MFDKKSVFWFVGLTFALTWLCDLAIYLRGGLGSSGWMNLVQLSAMMPAFSAIVLGMFFFPESPIFHKRPAGRGRWFYYFFLLYVLIHAIGVLCVWLDPSLRMEEIVAYLTQLPLLVGLFLLIALRFAADHEGMARVWLSWGSWRFWLLFGFAIAAYHVASAALNALFGLSKSELVTIAAPQGFNPVLYTILNKGGVMLIGAVVVTMAIFGEEYGWRGYLQNELFKLGRIRGALLLGAIWGAFHWPMILMGWNYPGQPLLGLVLEVPQCIGLGLIFSYAVLKSGSVLLASFLHAVSNIIMNPIVEMGFMPFDRVFCFGDGIYGTATLAVIAFFILRDPIWRGKGSNLAQPVPAPASMAIPVGAGMVGKTANQVNPGSASCKERKKWTHRILSC